MFTKSSGSQRSSDRDAFAVSRTIMLSGVFAVLIAFTISFRYTEGEWPLPPHVRWHWVFLMVLVAAAIGAVHALMPERRWRGPTRVLAVGVALATTGALLLGPLPPADSITADWSESTWKLCFGVLILLSWLGMETSARRVHPTWMLLAILAAFAAASFVIVEARFAKAAQLAGATAATIGFVMAISVALVLFGRRLPIRGGMMAPLAMMLPALLLFGWFYNAGSVPTSAFVLAGAGPHFINLSTIQPLRGIIGWRGGVVRIILCMILSVAAVILTMITAEPSSESNDYQW